MADVDETRRIGRPLEVINRPVFKKRYGSLIVSKFGRFVGLGPNFTLGMAVSIINFHLRLKSTLKS